MTNSQQGAIIKAQNKKGEKRNVPLELDCNIFSYWRNDWRNDWFSHSLLLFDLIRKKNKMEGSLARELVRIQDTLASIIPNGLWQRWAEVNEEVVWVLENLCGDTSWQTAEDQL